jgi:hypothetical protein
MRSQDQGMSEAAARPFYSLLPTFYFQPCIPNLMALYSKP